MNNKIVSSLFSLVFLAYGVSHADEIPLSESDARKLEQRIMAGIDDNPHLLEECRTLPTDRRVRLLMNAVRGARRETRSLGHRLLRETPGWDDYIEERLKVQWPLEYAYRQMRREALLGGPRLDLPPEKQKMYANAEIEVVQIFNMLRYIGDPKAVRFLMIGIYDNTPGYHVLDVVSGPAAEAPIAVMGLAMSKAGGEMAVPNVPESVDVEVWRKWWNENKQLYIPAGKNDLFTEYGVVPSPIPPRPAWVSKVRPMQTPEPPPSSPVATLAPAPETNTTRKMKSWAAAGVIGALFLATVAWLRRAKR